jgi:hypothetical protein
VDAPLAVNVAELPLQIAVGDEVAEIVGLGFTETVIAVVLEQVPLEPVTV